LLVGATGLREVIIIQSEIKEFLKRGKTGKRTVNGIWFRGRGVQVLSSRPGFARTPGRSATEKLICLLIVYLERLGSKNF
jgi:hypothetical protein